MAAECSLHLAFSFMAKTTEPLELGVWIVVWRHHKPIYCMNYYVYVKITNMATVRNFEVLSDRFNTE
jgi:hypothetical protein